MAAVAEPGKARAGWLEVGSIHLFICIIYIHIYIYIYTYIHIIVCNMCVYIYIVCIMYIYIMYHIYAYIIHNVYIYIYILLGAISTWLSKFGVIRVKLFKRFIGIVLF